MAVGCMVSQISMAILYPQYLGWRCDMTGIESPDAFFSKKAMDRIKKTWKILEDSPYRLAREENVGVDYLDRFVPVYTEHIGAKKNGFVYPVKERILTGIEKGGVYEAFSLYERDALIGGFIYAVRTKSLSSCFRAFPHKLPIAVPASISHLGEHMLFARALELEKKFIKHGKDRNAYGLHSNIGLAQYKMRLGCDPWVSKTPENVLLEVPALCEGTDALFFLSSELRGRMVEGILVSDQSQEELVSLYPTLLNPDSRCKIHLVRHGDLAAFLETFQPIVADQPETVPE